MNMAFHPGNTKIVIIHKTGGTKLGYIVTLDNQRLT